VVKGDNVMKGYLLHDNPGVIKPPVTELGEGWYDTGDIVSMDEDGFITINGRAKRFAKIGGEMISLTAVEELASKAWPDKIHAVVSIPDDVKGEQLVLLTNHEGPERKELITYVRENGISELNVPKKIVYQKDIPLLGTGKTNYSAVSQLVAKEFAA